MRTNELRTARWLSAYMLAFGMAVGVAVAGDYNQAIGPGAGEDVTGNYNQASGRNAGQGVTGNSNQAIGPSAGVNVTGRDNQARSSQSTQRRCLFSIARRIDSGIAVGQAPGFNTGPGRR